MTRPFIIQMLFISSTFGLYFIHPLFLLLLIAPLIINIIDILSLDISNDAAQIFCSLYLSRTKRVYTEYGRFYVVVRKDKLHLYQDKLFYLKYIDHQWYSSLENTKEWVKKQCEATTRSERAKDELLKSIKGWNGCVDLQSERDKKLDKLIN